MWLIAEHSGASGENQLQLTEINSVGTKFLATP